MTPEQQQNPFASPQTASSLPAAPAVPSKKIPIGVHLMCGWPLILVLLGGLIGGALGGGAYALNMAIYNSKLPAALKVVLNIVTGLAAVGIWIAIVAAIAVARQ